MHFCMFSVTFYAVRPQYGVKCAFYEFSHSIIRLFINRARF